MRIDSHQHFWKYTPEEYPWIGEGMDALRRDFLPEDLEPVLRGSGFQGCIAVQARQSLEETRWLLELARDRSFIHGVVGWADLCAPEAEERLTELAADPKLVGIRHTVQDEADDRFLLRDDFRGGLELLAGHGLVYDLLLHPRHLPVAAELCSELPGQSFVLDHLAKPFIRSGEKEPWKTDIQALAGLPNVACKISGLVTEADWAAWRPEDFSAYIRIAYEAFGEDRVLFGSDWPVCTLAADYDGVHGLLRRWAGHLNAAAHIKLFGGNAARLYGLYDRVVQP